VQEPIHIISLGAGVQSSTMALMAAKGEITPMPKAAIFADTKAEPKSVYSWLDWLEKQLPFPVIRVVYKAGLTRAIERSLETRIISGTPPWFTKNESGEVVLVSRACTHDFKVHPVQMKVRELSGAKRGEKGKAVLWIGISTDEVMRIKDSRYPHQVHRWPLIEAKMNRNNCLAWMERNGLPKPSKSSCVYCPYHSNAHWREIKDNDPAGWAESIRIDNLIREGVRRNGKPPMFVHRSCKPLAEVDLSTEEERGQLSMFNNECEGMCGV
jgi:hypothetical protein